MRVALLLRTLVAIGEEINRYGNITRYTPHVIKGLTISFIAFRISPTSKGWLLRGVLFKMYEIREHDYQE
jgi:hypothetical protein